MTGIFKGLQQLISNFRTIIDFIKMFIQFGISLVKSIFDLFNLVLNLMSTITGIIATLPSWLIAFATLTIGICVIFLIVGREHGN